MNPKTWPVRAVVLLALVLGLTCRAQDAKPADPAPQADQPARRPGSDYIRVHDSDDGDHVTLQIAIRSFAPSDPKLPAVHLVGAVHIGDKSYYKSVQEFLDQQDLVLFEGVKPSDAGSDLTNADDAAKAKVTKSRQRFLAVLISRYQAEHNALPDDLDALLKDRHGTVARLGNAATKDGWGNPQQYTIIKGLKPQDVEKPASTQDTFDIISLGADGKNGGEGAASDLKFSAQKPLTKDEVKSSGEGIQVQLAKAMGLEFQLVGIDYNREKWRNSDMTVDQLQDRLEAAGMSGSALFSMLDGSSFMGKLAGVLLNMLGSSPEGSAMLKAMMVEMLAHADELLATSGDQLGKGMGQFMKVLVIDRNATVFADLEKVMKDEPNIRSVALFFGAGHLPDMESRLEKMGYKLSDTQWKDAIDVNLTKLPGGKAQAKQIRQMMTGMIEAQKKAAKKSAPAKGAEPTEQPQDSNK
jgi:Type II secretion system (T2SS), protein G